MTPLRYAVIMRQMWIALFCIVFSMSGSLIQAAHAMAHAETSETTDNSALHSDHHHNAHAEDKNDADPAEPQKNTGHSNDHGAELHFTALGVAELAAGFHLPDGALKVAYREHQYPAPLLPPDPDPDRA